MARGLFVLLVLTVGCVSPPLVVSTGGLVTTGPEVEELVRFAGVSQVSVPLTASGNGVWVGENRLLSVAHLAVLGPQFLIEGSVVQAVTVCMGNYPVQDWAVLETDLPDPPAPCLFPPADEVAPGQDVLVVGYLVGEGGTRAVSVAGTVIDSAVFRGEAENRGLVCMDLGPQKWPGLSGAAVLTKDAAGAWRLAGVQEGWLETSRGEIVSVFVPLSQLCDRHGQQALLAFGR